MRSTCTERLNLEWCMVLQSTMLGCSNGGAQQACMSNHSALPGSIMVLLEFALRLQPRPGYGLNKCCLLLLMQMWLSCAINCPKKLLQRCKRVSSTPYGT